MLSLQKMFTREKSNGKMQNIGIKFIIQNSVAVFKTNSLKYVFYMCLGLKSRETK